MPSKIIIGRFGAPHGVKGWLKLQSFAQNYADILNYDPWFISTPKGWKTVEIEAVRVHGDKLIVKLINCDDPEMARAYTNLEIAIDKTQLPDLPEHEYYWSDLEGLEVVTQDGVELGKVEHLIETGSNDVLIIQGHKRHLIPYIKTVVLKVDLQSKKIIVDWDPEF